MNGTNMSVGGCLTFWKLAESTSRSQLEVALTNLGEVAFLPDARTSAACLRDALEQAFPARTGCRVMKKRRHNCFEIIRIVYAEADEDNQYHKAYDFSIDEKRVINVRPYSWELLEQVSKEFNTQLDLLRPAAIANALVSYLTSLGGTKGLRPSGGLYWLPASVERAFRAFGNTIEAAALGRGTQIYHIHHQMDEDAIKAVLDAITAEVLSESERIHSEIVSGELGDKALAARAQEAQALRDKIKLYEGLLDVGLGHLLTSVDRAEEAVSAGAILGAGVV